MLGLDLNTFCTDTSEMLQLVGKALMILKVGIPFILIGLGIIDLAKVAISAKPEEIKKTAVSLIWRIVGGIAIFFLPMIVIAMFGLVSGFNNGKKQIDWAICESCLNNPWEKSKCENAVKCKTDDDQAACNAIKEYQQSGD